MSTATMTLARKATALRRRPRRLPEPILSRSLIKPIPIPTTQPEPAILQLQLVGQANFSEQEGAAIAAATSDYVSVDQSGYLNAGGDGITATSSAVAGAGLSQTANQFNTNSATATLEGSGFGAVAAQLQLVGQLNVNDQDGAAIADATSSYVEVRSYEDPSEGNGITATSSAVAGANLDQTANQTNTNTASITLPAQPVVPASTEFPLTGT